MIFCIQWRWVFALLFCIYAVCKVLCHCNCFILSDDDFRKKSKIYSHNCLSCFIHILNCKMTLFFGMCSFVNKAKLHRFKELSTKMKLYYIIYYEHKKGKKTRQKRRNEPLSMSAWVYQAVTGKYYCTESGEWDRIVFLKSITNQGASLRSFLNRIWVGCFHFITRISVHSSLLLLPSKF